MGQSFKLLEWILIFPLTISGMHSGIRHNFWFQGINLVITIGKCATKVTNFVGLPHAFASDVIALEEGMCMFTSNLFEN